MANIITSLFLSVSQMSITGQHGDTGANVTNTAGEATSSGSENVSRRRRRVKETK